MAQKPSLLDAAELLPELLGDGTQGIDRRSPVAALLGRRVHLTPNAAQQAPNRFGRGVGGQKGGVGFGRSMGQRQQASARHGVNFALMVARVERHHHIHHCQSSANQQHRRIKLKPCQGRS